MSTNSLVEASSSQSTQLQIKLITKQEQYSVPDTTFAVPSNVKTAELNNLVNGLLNEENDETRKKIEFDFLALGEFIRTELGEHVTSRGASTESIVDIEYVERFPSPEPKDCLLHDDWVSAVHVKGRWILTGCYDSTLHLWTLKGKHKLTIPGHTECVKAVAFINLDDTKATFISGSHDQTVLIWNWNVEENVIDHVQVCKGHTRGIECVGVSLDTTRFASGGWDSFLKIWATEISEDDLDGQSESKRSKPSDKGKHLQTRSPLVTLKGHKEAITGLCWRESGELITSSWDHTLRLWDSDVGTCLREFATNKAMTDVHSSPHNGLLVASAADRHVRLFDPKSNDGVVIKCTYSSHTQWVQTVRWSPTNEHLFISGAYDNIVKLWDTRSPKVPLFDMTGHEDKVLCSDWSNPSLTVSGGSDNTVRMFKQKNVPPSEPMDI